MNEYQWWLLALYDDNTCTVLGLEPRTLDKAVQAKAWQKVGFPNDEYRLVHRYAADCFFDPKAKEKFVASRGAYTQEAWNKFIQEWEDSHNPLLKE